MQVLFFVQEVLQNIVIDNNIDEIDLNENIEREVAQNTECPVDAINSNAIPGHQTTSCDEPNAVSTITASQFLLPDELLPSLNPENLNTKIRIILHPEAITEMETPIPIQRIWRPGPYNVSPYISFGSETGSTSKQPNIFKQKHPFNDIFETLDTSLYMSFSKWLNEGLLAKHQARRKKEDRYKNKKAALTMPFAFGVHNASDKNWFYKLANEGQLIGDSSHSIFFFPAHTCDHVAKYPNNPDYLFNIVDCHFSYLIHGIWEAYQDSNSGKCNASSERTIIEYINNFRMQAASPWHAVDNILIPVNVKDKIHWFLMVVSFNDRCIMIYDSIRSTFHDTYIDNEVKRFAELIPMDLVMSDFYKNRNLNVTTHPKYKNHTKYDPFETVRVNDIPQQEEGSLDCGLYTAVFAEYLSNGKGIPQIQVKAE